MYFNVYNILYEDQQTFSIKGQIGNISRFVGHSASVTLLLFYNPLKI